MVLRSSPASLNVSRIAFAALGAACVALSAAIGSAEPRPSFSEGEIKTILSHGPWPAPAAHDPTNRVSGMPNAIELGTILFFDHRLSGTGTKACGSCHVPDRNWTDNLSRGVGMAALDRNTPTIVNLRRQRWYGWDGAADSLWFQSLRPIVDARELAATPRHVAHLLRTDEQLSCRYQKVFGAPPSPADDEDVFVNVGKVLAAFQETLFTGRTPFDQFREALARGESPSSLSYSTPSQRGLQLFIGKAGCSACHSGPNFTNGEFFKTRLSRPDPGNSDPGRDAGTRQLRESRFNLLGAYNDDPTGASAAHTRQVASRQESYGEFKVPSLRNLMLTAPYGHRGDVETIAEVVRVHARDGQAAGAPELTPREQTDLVVFLESLSTFTNPWRPDDPGRCQ